METSKKGQSMSPSEILDKKNPVSISNKAQSNLDFSEIINKLTEIIKEGDSLFKQSKIEESKDKYLLGYDIFTKENEKSLNLLTYDSKILKIVSLYKDILSKIAECFYLQKKYEDSIEYDLKLICLEPKNIKSIVRLFYSYLKKQKYQQANFYGDLFLEFDKDTKDKYKDVLKDIENFKSQRENIKINKIVFNFISFVIIILAIKLFIRVIRTI